jgi:hypothetical protein
LEKLRATMLEMQQELAACTQIVHGQEADVSQLQSSNTKLQEEMQTSIQQLELAHSRTASVQAMSTDRANALETESVQLRSSHTEMQEELTSTLHRGAGADILCRDLQDQIVQLELELNTTLKDASSEQRMKINQMANEATRTLQSQLELSTNSEKAQQIVITHLQTEMLQLKGQLATSEASVHLKERQMQSLHQNMNILEAGL